MGRNGNGTSLFLKFLPAHSPTSDWRVVTEQQQGSADVSVFKREMRKIAAGWGAIDMAVPANADAGAL